jgi:hypothetical protein
MRADSLDTQQEIVTMAAEALGLERPKRSPMRAALFSAVLPGAGQLYNRRLDRAILTWLWTAILIGLGLSLLFLGLLGSWTRELPAPAPLGDVIADNGWDFAGGWCLTWVGFWVWNIRDAADSARKINDGLIDVRHPLRWQLVHVLGSQVLGLIPVVGVLFPPGAVAEAMDAARERRSPDHGRLLREGGQALLEWAVVRAALWTVGGLTAIWLLWWLSRAVF